MEPARRFAGPAIAFLIGTGLEVSGIEAPILTAVFWGVAAIWVVAMVVTHERFRNSTSRVAFWVSDRMPVTLQFSVARKHSEIAADATGLGFLDFEAVAVRAMRETTKTLDSIAKETKAMGKTFGRYTPRFSAAVNWSPEGRQALGRETGAKIDHHARQLDSRQAVLRNGIETMAVNYLERIKYAPPEAAGEIRPPIVGMQQAVAGTRPSVVRMREAAIKLRNQNIQQAINQALDRLVDVLGRLISDLDAVTRFTTDALRLIDEKAAQARMAEAEAAPPPAKEPGRGRSRRERPDAT